MTALLRCRYVLLASFLIGAAPVGAQGVDSLAVDSLEALDRSPAPALTVVEQIDSLHDALEPALALDAAKAALADDSTDYEVLWRASRSQGDLAKMIKGDEDSVRDRRDSLYAVAEVFARRAIASDSLDPEGHFILGVTLGQLSLTRGGGDRVKFAREIYEHAALALEMDPEHDGAHHVVGMWHAEIRRLSGFSRFMAKTFMGAGFMGRAAWDSAAAHLEASVAIEPNYIHHRLALAEIYADMERWEDAERQLVAIPDLPTRDVLDDDHREAAEALLVRVREELEEEQD
jgi:hypothetical protein